MKHQFITMPNSFAFLACYFVLSKCTYFFILPFSSITSNPPASPAVYVNSLLGTLNARSKMQSPADAAAPGAKHLHLSGNSNSNTDSSAYTSSGSGQGVGALLTSAIMLGTNDFGTETMAGEEEIRQFEEEREKSTWCAGPSIAKRKKRGRNQMTSVNGTTWTLNLNPSWSSSANACWTGTKGPIRASSDR